MTSDLWGNGALALWSARPASTRALGLRADSEVVRGIRWISLELRRALCVENDVRFHTKPDHRRRTLDAASLIVALVFSQMRRLESLRAIAEALGDTSRVRSVLGLSVVRRSTLSDALWGRLRKSKPDTRLLDFTQALFHTIARHAGVSLGKAKNTATALLAVDGTVFNATAKMLFARFDSTRNALKAHVAFNIADYVPTLGRTTRYMRCGRGG